jgi:hypothetical protein
MLVKKIINAICFILFIGFTNSILSQNGKKLNVLYEKAIYKTIEGYTANYSAEGYVLKNEFVENGFLTFKIEHPISYDKILRDTIISGRYFTSTDGNTYIEGIWKDFSKDFRKIISIKGIFKLTNNTNGIGISTNKKKADILNIFTVPNTSYYVKINTDFFSLNSNIYNSDEIQLYQNLSKFGKFNYTYPTLLKEILNDKNVKLLFKNKDKFTGIVKENLGSESLDYIPYDGEYQYATGDVLKGKIFMWGNIFLIDKGTTTFKDGSVSSDRWLESQYGISGFSADELIKASNSLTELRDLAEKKYNAKKQEKEKLLKVKSERLDKQDILKKELIRKYGDFIGEKLSRGELVVGMNKNMVNEVWKKEYFIVSTSINKNQIVEIWEFDIQRFQIEIIKESGKTNPNGEENALVTLQLFEISKQLGINELNNPKILIFKDDKLTDIYN